MCLLMFKVIVNFFSKTLYAPTGSSSIGAIYIEFFLIDFDFETFN